MALGERQRGVAAVSSAQLAFKEFGKLWKIYATRGVGSYIGVPWQFPAGADERWAWHQNLGELMNSHLMVNVGSHGTSEKGTPRFRLTLSITHHDLLRLVEVQKVAQAGRIQLNPHHTRLMTYEVWDETAFLLMKAGRLFVDPANSLTLELLDAATSFRRYVGQRGGKKKSAEEQEKQVAAQIFWRDQIERLSLIQRTIDLSHDCRHDLLAAGAARWR